MIPDARQPQTGRYCFKKKKVIDGGPESGGSTSMKTLGRIAILLLASWGACASGASAQGWKKYRASLYEVSLPADWSCRYDEKARRMAATSPDGEIFFSARGEPGGGARATAGDPSLLKKRLVREYELLNATDGTAFDVTTKSVAVETVNGLRGVVVELTAVVPARREDGGLFLKKFSGFALVAEGGAARYSAIILCPVGRFTYHSAVMNRIINDLRPLGAAVQTPRQGVGPTPSRGVSSLDGEWLLSHAGGRYRVELRVRGGSGTMRVRWNDKRGKTLVVEQRVTLGARHYGLLVVGSRPIYVSGDRGGRPYAADTLLFQRQPDDSFKVWIRDDEYVKEWEPLNIDSYATLDSLPAQ